ncbi:uncharacterized protein LOC135833908 [Planococcus citri]|uniref:uncharacterized protein LOC135833908 n=1 Tax=Planococcus citri TaxID=170843 RepID=UPI0031FA4026
MGEKFCGIFSQRTGTIIILSFPVMLILQASILALFISSSESISEPGVWKIILLGIILGIFCIIGLLGVEQKNPSFLLPVLCLMIIFIISNGICQILYFLNYFQLTNFQNTFTSTGQCLYFVVFNAMLMNASTTVFNHFEELQLHKSDVARKFASTEATLVHAFNADFVLEKELTLHQKSRDVARKYALTDAMLRHAYDAELALRREVKLHQESGDVTQNFVLTDAMMHKLSADELNADLAALEESNLKQKSSDLIQSIV